MKHGKIRPKACGRPAADTIEETMTWTEYVLEAREFIERVRRDARLVQLGQSQLPCPYGCSANLRSIRYSNPELGERQWVLSVHQCPTCKAEVRECAPLFEQVMPRVSRDSKSMESPSLTPNGADADSAGGHS